MPIRFINPADLATPTGYAQVVTIDAQQVIYIAGQIALNQPGELVGKDDFVAQTQQVYQHLKRALNAVGATVENVVKTTTYVVNTTPDKLRMVGQIRTQYQTAPNLPASTYIGVERLALGELLIEIEAIAVIS